MGKHSLIDRCPFREGTASHAVYKALAASAKPLSLDEVASRSRVARDRVGGLLAEYLNPYHFVPLVRKGVRVVRRKDGKFALEFCKPKPNAKRPARGKASKVKNTSKMSTKSVLSVKRATKPPADTAQNPSAVSLLGVVTKTDRP